jgi:hypothetical protein
MKCPYCGCAVSLNDLRKELTVLQERERERKRRKNEELAGGLIAGSAVTVGIAGGAVTVGLVDPYEVCARCGALWKRGAKEEAEGLRKEILALKDPVEALADLAESDDGAQT